MPSYRRRCNPMRRLVESTFATFFALFAPILTILASVVFLVMADLLTGIIKAIKNGEPVQSQNLRLTVIKLGVYIFIISIAHVVELYLVDGKIPVLSVITSIIGITEFKSVLENLDDISGGNLLGTIIHAIGKHLPPNHKK